MATALFLGLAPGAEATTVTYSPRNGTVFNNPKGTKAQQLAIITQIDRALDAAPPGSTVRMAQYLFDIDSVADKMIAAYRRGVHMQVLVDRGEKRVQILRVRKVLGTNKSKLSFVATCRHSCMADTSSVMHAKFYLFSRSGNANLVSMISSANPYTGNTFKSWNDIHTVVGDKNIYDSLVKYFVDMLKDQNTPDYYRTTTSGNEKLYLYPRAVHAGINTVAILDVLNHVRCTGVARGFGYRGRTVIRVAMWGWSGARLDVAKRLWTLHNQGCSVTVIYNSGRTSRSVTAALLRRSRYGMMGVYDSWVDKNHNGVAEIYMHLKMVTINGVWFGHPNTKVTYTGSQNFTGVAIRANNDLLLRIIDPATHDAYARNFDFILRHYPKRVTQVPSARRSTSDAHITQTANAGDGV